MKKSMIATAVVATAGLAVSANAGYWSISGMNYTNGTNDDIGTGTSSMQNQVNTYVSTNFTGTTGSATALTQTDVGNILGASGVNVTLADNTLTYFGFEDTGGGPGFFATAFKNTSGSSYYFTVNAGPQAANGTEGVLTTFGTSGAAAGGYLQNGTVANGTTMLVIFGGLDIAESFTLNVTSTADSSGSGTGSNFAISYLNWGGSAYSEYASAAGATASGMNIGVYAIPVPAPALLAGAGLVGAAALRRRMTKKA